MSAPVIVRPPHPGEAGAIAQLINAASQAEFGVDDVSETEIRRWFDQPELDTARDVFIAEQDGCLIAYADISNEGKAFEQFWVDVRLPPNGSEAAGDAVLAAAERRAGEFAAESPSGKEPRIVAGAWSVSEHVTTLLERTGYRLYRHSFRMVTDLDDDLPQPRFPDGIEVRGFRPGEERAVFDATDEAFQDSWDHVPGVFEEWRHWGIEREDFDPALWWLALAGDDIAGVCLCRPYETEPDMGWVSSLAVRRPWRRRGIARGLLVHCFHEFRTRGFARVGLGVDADSLTGANRLYESAGMRPIRRYDLYEKHVSRR